MGSLFKLRDYWYCKYAEEEFAHTSAMAVGNVDNDPSNASKIILGSLSGVLRVLLPNKKGIAGPADTILEREFGSPILQVACHPLEPVSGGSPRNLLAVLFPNRLLFVRIQSEGKIEKDDVAKEDCFDVNYSLFLCNEAHLNRVSYNFVCGAFGRASYELVCVQSMDGCFTVVDHNAILLQCILPKSQFLLPGCLAYCPERDCLLTNNSAMNLMCYPFTAFTNNSVSRIEHVDGIEEAGSEVNDNSFEPTWSFNLGEDVVGIEVCRHTRGLEAGDVDIVVLCHHTLFVLQLNGVLRYSKRMDVESLCIASYFVPNSDACNLLIGTNMGLVNVYSDMSLEWSAKMSSAAPKCLCVAEFLKTKGMIVTLGTDGAVAVNYLGTDPEEDPIQPLESKEGDYAEMEQETRRVLHAIKRVSSNIGKGEAVKKPVVAAEQLCVEWSTVLVTSTHLSDSVNGDNSVGNTNISNNDGSERMGVATLTLHNTTQLDILGDVTVVVHVVEPVQVDLPQRVLSNMSSGAVVKQSFWFKTVNNKNMIIPSSLEARAVVVYTNNANVTCTANAVLRLPLALVAKAIPPVSDAEFMIQLNTEEKQPVSLIELFQDMANSGEISANIISIRYVNGADVTVLCSKNACRFRLRASTMEALWLLFDELHRRVLSYYNSEVQFSIPDPIPLHDYFSVIDFHLSVRKQAIEAHKALTRAAHMFCVVQKRLLLLVRERNPSSASMIDVLLEESYRNLQKNVDNLDTIILHEKQAAAKLSCCSRFVFLQLLIKSHDTLKDPSTINILKSIFACDVGTNSEIDWEEATQSILGHFLLESGRNCRNMQEEKSPSFDSVLLKKYISDLFNKLLKGSHVSLV